MSSPYFPVLVFIVIACGFALSMLVIGIFFGPNKIGEIKDDPFECGTIGVGSARDRFSVRFYLVAMVFIVFDIEIVFLYPWATQVGALGWSSLIAAMFFVSILAVGLAYIWRRGVLDWS